MTSLFHAKLDATSFAPPKPPGMLRAIGLALLAHALLIAALTWGVHWKQQESPAVEAEIWSTATQQAAPRAVEPPPPVVRPEPVTPPSPPPPPQVTAPAKPAPLPPPPDLAVREAQIALERETKRREVAQRERELAVKEQQQRKAIAEKKRVEQEQLKAREAKEAQAKRDAEAKARKDADNKAQAQARKAADAADAKRKAAAQEQAQQVQQEQEAESRRQANLKRIQGLAGASGSPTAAGTALQSTGPSASYGARVSARVRPNIVFPDDIPGNPSADVEVRCAPDGTIIGRRLVKSSGVKAWDEAVLRAIDKTETMPRDTDGRVPSPLTIGFRPKEG